MSETELEQITQTPEVESAPITESIEPVVEEKPQSTAKTFEEALERKIAGRDKYQQKKQEKAQEQVAQSAPQTPEDAAAQEAAKVAKKPKGMPTSWGKSVTEHWEKLPEEIRAEIAKREEEITRGFTKDGEEKKFAREMRDMFGEYEKQGINFPRGYKDTVKDLLGAAKILNYGSPQEKLAFISNTARSVGIDLQSYFGANQNESGVEQRKDLSNPEIYDLKQKLAHLESTLSQQMQLQDQMQSKEANEIIQKFASDPAHKYYHQVAPQMGRLIQGGFASSLEEAYEKAINLDPDLHSMRLEEARQEAIAKFREKLSAQTDAARKAAVSINGAAPIDTPRDTRELPFEQALARRLGV